MSTAEALFSRRNLVAAWVVVIVLLAIGGYTTGSTTAAVGAGVVGVVFGLVVWLAAKITTF